MIVKHHKDKAKYGIRRNKKQCTIVTAQKNGFKHASPCSSGATEALPIVTQRLCYRKAEKGNEDEGMSSLV